MTIKLNEALRFAGSIVASGTETTLSEALEADLIQQGKASRVGDPPNQSGLGVPVTAKTNPLTGGLRSSVGNRVMYDDADNIKLPGAVFCNWQTAQGALVLTSAGAGSSAALDSTVLIDGLPSLKCTFATVGDTFQATYTPTNPISVANLASLQIPVIIGTNNITENGGVGNGAATPFQVWLTGATGKSYRYFCAFDGIPPGGKHVFHFDRASTIGAAGSSLLGFAGGATGWADIDGDSIVSIKIIQASTANANAYPVWVGPLRINQATIPRVSIVLDGEYASQYTLIKPLLDKYGFKASFAIVNSYIGQTVTWEPCMTLAQLQECYGQGHEMIHHTFDASTGPKTNGYVDATGWPTSKDICNDINSGWAFFRANGWLRGIGKAVAAFSEAFTYTTLTARQKLVYDGMRAAGVEAYRKSTNFYTQQMTAGNKGTTPWMIRGAIQVTNTHVASDLIATTTQAIAAGGWSVVTLHHACPDADTPGLITARVGVIDAYLADLYAKQQAGRVRVGPFGETFDAYFK